MPSAAYKSLRVKPSNIEKSENSMFSYMISQLNLGTTLHIKRHLKNLPYVCSMYQYYECYNMDQSRSQNIENKSPNRANGLRIF